VLEPVVMLATVVQWMILATIVGGVVGSGVSAFLHILFFATERSTEIPSWMQSVLLPLGGLANGVLLYYGYRASSRGLKDSIQAAVFEQGGRMPLRTILIKPVAAIITLACGGSAGKEGPCSHLGASLGSAIGRVFRLNAELQQRI